MGKNKKRPRERQLDYGWQQGSLFENPSDAERLQAERRSHEPSSQSFETMAAEIGNMISKGKSKEALFKAKEIDKTMNSAESKALVAKTYLARIRGMLEHGYYIEAQALMGLVAEKYPLMKNDLEEVSFICNARKGTVDEMAVQLLDPQTSTDRRKAIEVIIRCHVSDPAVLIQCAALPPEHPLKRGALEIKKAFAAITSRQVTNEEIELPDISRKSPLAPWKMLIRALACFYRHEDKNSEKFLDAIEADSVPARLVPVIKAMISGKPAEDTSPAASLLRMQVKTDFEKFEKSLRVLDEALHSENSSKIIKAIDYAVAACRQEAPPLLEKLKQHISIRASLANVPAKKVFSAMGGPSLKNPYFWRLFARAQEEAGLILQACSLWEEYRRNAVQAGIFFENSPQVVAIYLHMAALLRVMPFDELVRQRKSFVNNFTGYGEYYLDQPPEIKAAAPREGEERAGVYFLFPEQLYERACKINSDPEVFRLWLGWVGDHFKDAKVYDAVALGWHKALPGDSHPLLHLMKSAERRSAFNLALGYLEKAENLDGLNPEVKRARLRLLVSITIRHLKQDKPLLADKDLNALASLPQWNEGDRPAFLEALQWVVATLKGDNRNRSEWQARIASSIGSDMAAWVILNGIGTSCGLKKKELPYLASDAIKAAGKRLVEEVARGCSLGIDMGVDFWVPLDWEKPLMDSLNSRESNYEEGQLLTLAEAALRAKSNQVAYCASGAGLARGDAKARFLFLRAKSLPPFTNFRREKCLTMAIKLARSQQDPELVQEAVEYLHTSGIRGLGRVDLWSNLNEMPDPAALAGELEEVLRKEGEAKKYPRGWDDDFFRPKGNTFGDVCNCPVCRRRRGENPLLDPLFDDPEDDFDEDDEVFIDDEEEDDEDDFPEDWEDEREAGDSSPLGSLGLPANLPPKLLKLLMDLIFKYGGSEGRVPSPQELAKRDPDLMGKLTEAFQEFEGQGPLERLFGGRQPGSGQKQRNAGNKKKKKDNKKRRR